MCLKASLSSLDFYLPSAFSKPWKGQANVVKKYWQLYGGWKSFLLSPYTQAAFVIGLADSYWHISAFDAANAAITILPNVLGFTVGALSIILAFSSSEFFVYLTQEGVADSLFMKTIANFVHFVLIQVATLIVSVFTIAHNNKFLEVLCSVALALSLLTTVSIVIQLFQMAAVFNLSKRPNAASSPSTAEKPENLKPKP